VSKCFYARVTPPPAGTAILSKHKPLNVSKDLPGHPDPSSVKGRIVTLEFEGCYVIGTYVVNAGEKLKVSAYDTSEHSTSQVSALFRLSMLKKSGISILKGTYVTSTRGSP
jgi:exonuclease III